MAPKNLTDKTVSNLFWSYTSLFVSKALNLGAIIIIAAYLSPAEFGVMAFSIVILGYFELTQGFGMGSYLISTRDDLQKATHAVFFFAVAMSSLIVFGIWNTADYISQFFGQNEIAVVLKFLSVSLLIESFAQVHNSLMQRELKFRLKILPEAGRSIAKGLVSIALAIGGFGVWALVYGHIVGTLAWTVIVMTVRPWRPQEFPHVTAIWTAIRYGSNIFLGILCNAVPRTIDQLLIGKFLGPGPLGLYSVGYRMPQLALKTFSMEANKVLHPVMATIQQDFDALQRYYYGTVRYFCIIIFPLGVAISLLTSPLVHVIYNEQWRGMIPVMQILSIGLALGVLNGLPGNLYKAVNRSDYFMVTALINLPLYIAAFFIAVRFGIEAVALAHVIMVFVSYVPNFFILRRLIGIDASTTVRSTLPGLACSIAAALGGFGAQAVVSEPGLLQLIATAAGCATAYLIALWLAAPEVLSEFRRIAVKAVRSRRRSDKP